MRALDVSLRAALSLAVVAGAGACSVITSTDRFKQDEGATSANRSFDDLKFTVVGMTSHVNEKFEYRVIDANNLIQMRGFVEPLGDVRATMFVPNAVPR